LPLVVSKKLYIIRLSVLMLSGIYFPLAGASQNFIQRGYAVVTHEAFNGSSGNFSFSVYNLTTSAAQLPGSLYEPTIIHPFTNDSLTWSSDSVGTVFGTTFDADGNIYLASTSSFLIKKTGNANHGGVYKVDAPTGYCHPFIYSGFSPMWIDSFTIPNTGPALGNITYDRWHNQLFLTNHEDGMIYRIGMNGKILERYDPFLNDNGAPGFCQLGERLWGLCVIAQPGNMYRVVFSKWNEDALAISSGFNEIWSIDINAQTGAFGTSLVKEFNVPSFPGENFSYPVSDISFDGNERILLSEKGQENDTNCSPHRARLLEYKRSGNNFAFIQEIYLGRHGTFQNSAGGNDYGIFDPNRSDCILNNFIWATSDAIFLNDAQYGSIYGFLGVPYSGNSNIPSAPDFVQNEGMFADYNGLYSDIPKMRFGDISIYRIDTCGLIPDTTVEFICPVNECSLPNVISPDGNSVNDTLVFNCIHPGECDASLDVFDRWGNSIAHFDNYDNSWSPQNIADHNLIYYYVVRFHQSGKCFRNFLHIR
jgi:hypothetical protein